MFNFFSYYFTSLNGDENGKVLISGIITYGLIRLLAQKEIAYFTLLIEAFCFFNELFYNDFYLYKLLFCIITCIYIYIYFIIYFYV